TSRLQCGQSTESLPVTTSRRSGLPPPNRVFWNAISRAHFGLLHRTVKYQLAVPAKSSLASPGPSGLCIPIPVGAGARRRRSSDLQVLGRGLAAIAHDLVFDLLAFIERAEPGPLDGRNVHEHVLTTTLRLDKAVALGGIEPLHGTCR